MGHIVYLRNLFKLMNIFAQSYEIIIINVDKEKREEKPIISYFRIE